ncbi:unnamed protein product [Trichogramma brassicae]|uniref:Uncharacterized protein n=1 Tax=Trichogramma brassicae TaxID=86971 RepID=A0A6H5IWV5_9HYME|nr:unnamed protein product [Trichogramma brassicae]
MFGMSRCVHRPFLERVHWACHSSIVLVRSSLPTLSRRREYSLERSSMSRVSGGMLARTYVASCEMLQKTADHSQAGTTMNRGRPAGVALLLRGLTPCRGTV